MPNSVHPRVKEPAEKAGQHEPLYVTEHSVPPEFGFPKDFRMEVLPGLLFCQVIVNDLQERRVIAWWKSRETAQAWRGQFTQLLGLHGVLSFEGFQLEHRAKLDPAGWLRPAAIAAAVSVLVAFLTGLSTIQDWGYSLLAIPDCTLWTDPVTATSPKTIGEPFAIQVQVKNRHLRASSTTTIKPVPTDAAVKLVGDTGSHRIRVEPGKAEVQEFRFIASQGGQYPIRFEGEQNGGSVYPTRAIPSLEITVDVWDSIDQNPRVSLVKASPRSASVSVDVRNAKATPYGTAFEATLKSPGEVDVRPDKRIIKEADDPLRNADFALLRWRVPPSTEALTVQRFRLVLQDAGSTTRTPAEWSDLLKRLIVHADEPDELSFAGARQ